MHSKLADATRTVTYCYAIATSAIRESRRSVRGSVSVMAFPLSPRRTEITVARGLELISLD